MGHTADRPPRPSRRQSGTATGQVPFSPLWQPPRMISARSKNPDAVTLLKTRTCPGCAGVRIRHVRRIFKSAAIFHL